MAFFRKKEDPKKKDTSNRSRCQHCANKGICSCLKTLANLRNSDDGPKVCAQMCKGPKGPACGKTMRGQVCPCGDC